MFNNKTIFLTGGTGSFGKNFINLTLKKYNPTKIIVYSRDEMKQWELRNILKSKKVKFILGDVRDKDQTIRAMSGSDIVIHAAATKIVPLAEENPSECIKTNVIGALNVIDACIENKVKKVVALSTDKASNPINLYGASKLASDKLFVSANFEIRNKQTKFCVVRYGNVITSRGSVIPFFKSLNTNIYPITDFRMTRFMITLEDSVQMVWKALDVSIGGEIFVKKTPSMRIIDVAKAINKRAKFKLIGIRPGEKLHEQLVGQDDAIFTYDFGDYYKIVSPLSLKSDIKKVSKNGKKVKKDFVYSSELNDEFLKPEDLKNIIRQNIIE